MPALKDPIEIDPIALQEDLKDRMSRYLLTALPIHRRFPKLRAEAMAQLGESAELIQGPFLEAMPDFPKRDSLEEMVDRGLLHPGFRDMDEAVFRRSLHQHQAEAIESLVEKEENVIVATGTGSGKTECFLFPLVDELLKAKVAGDPRIRAILVYPLNALANDQLYRRIVPLLVKELGKHGITVGRYTGQTTPGKSRSYFEEQYLQDPYFRAMFGDSIPSNWLLSRDEMLDTPPHVLVTNYAMLEHLLLLPRNAPLFTKADLRYIVLDEVHTYAGAQATEVSLLLRKLQNQYPPNSRLRCIGTSASLGNSERARQDISKFAQRLFGFPFQKVITAKRQAYHLLRSGSASQRLEPQAWIELHKCLRQVRHLDDENQRRERWNDMAMDADIDLLVEKEDMSLATLLCRALAKDQTVREVSRILSEEGLQRLSKLAMRLFPEVEPAQAQEALTGLVAIGAYAREAEDTFPLLPARYHVFTRGIEEATIQLASPAVHDEHACNLRFRREFRDEKTDKARYRLMTCRKCGELYFEGYEKSFRIIPERGGKGWHRSVFWLKAKDSHVLPSEASDDEADKTNTPDRVFVNLETGELKDLLDDEDNPMDWLETHRAKLDKPGTAELDANPDAPAKVVTCQSCGAQDSHEIVTPFHPGDQALSASICEVLYAHLPTSKDEAGRHGKPGRGRNLLVFSDNRQEAAFFAPSFQRTHEDLLVRRAILQLLKKEGASRLQGMADDLCHPNYLLRGGLTNRDGQKAEKVELATIVRGKVFAEFCSPGGSRSSLEDLGLVSIDYHMIELEELAQRARLAPDTGPAIIRWFLDSFRTRRAISMPSELRADDRFVWGLYAQDDRRATLEVVDPEARIRLLPQRRDDGSPRPNRYVEVLRDKLGIEDWEGSLRRIWNVLTDDSDGALLRADPDGTPMRVLDHRFLQARLRRADEPVYRCSRCSRISSYSIGGICTQWRCDGKTVPVDEREWEKETQRNHYHFMYSVLNDLPSVMAREHTAAIATALREDIESQFKSGDLNLLSSSTTMEMGIDLGDLEGVFLRNVPPDISNYQQRAGRAGRRAQAAPISITYSRNRRYDQDVFRKADEFVAREPRTPFVHLGNARLFQRHQFSVLVGAYLAHLGLDGTGLQIGQFFGLPKFNLDGGSLIPESGGAPEFSLVDETKFNDRLAAWLGSSQADKPKRLAGELLESLKSSLASREVESLTNTSAVLDDAFLAAARRLASTFGDRFRHYMDSAAELNEKGKGGVDAMRNRAYRWANQPIVNFLSKYGMIPTYSFPVDSIDLEVLQGKCSNRSDIELSRDARLGIVEYAPGAEVIANGRVWTSRAISQHPREFMPPFHYKICGECRHIEAWEDKSLIPGKCTSCNSDLNTAPRQFIEPRGFTTSLGESHGKEPGSSRELPPAALETQLIGNAPEKLFKGSDLLRVDWALQDAQDGRMVVINRGLGEGFVKCGCGFAQSVSRNRRQPERHNSPFTDHECTLTPSTWRFDLAHTFHTDVLQIRCRVPVSEPKLPGANPDRDEVIQAMEGVARSVCEALRLACCKLLEIPENEISTTYRWLPARGLELILFDNVPGGAGYTGKIVERNLSELFHSAHRDILDCLDDCSTSCSKCLRSYSNQLHWDTFRRQDAITWIDSLLKFRRTDPRIALGASLLTDVAVAELAEKATKIICVRERLGDMSGGMEADDKGRELPVAKLIPEWDKVGHWLASGKEVELACRQFPQFDDRSLPRARRLAELLLPHVRSGQLKLSEISGSLEQEGDDVPDVVILNGNTGKAALIYDPARSNSIFEEIWSASVLCREVTLHDVEQFLPAASSLGIGQLERPDMIQRFHYDSGQSRDLPRDLAFLKRGSLKRVEIVDRYLVACESNRASARQFMECLTSLFPAPPEEIVFRYGPCPQQRDRAEWIKAVDLLVKDLRAMTAYQNTEFRNELRGQSRQRNFHDRRLVAVFDRPPGSEIPQPGSRSRRRRGSNAGSNAPEQALQVVAELTGGIDVLMDNREETTIYVFEMNS